MDRWAKGECMLVHQGWGLQVCGPEERPARRRSGGRWFFLNKSVRNQIVVPLCCMRWESGGWTEWVLTEWWVFWPHSLWGISAGMMVEGGLNRMYPCLHWVVLRWQSGEILCSANTSRLHWGLPWVQRDLVVRPCGWSLGSGCFAPTGRTSLLRMITLAARFFPPELVVLWARLPKGMWERHCSQVRRKLLRHVMLRIFLTLSLISPFCFPRRTCCLHHLPSLLGCSPPHGQGSSLQRYSRDPPLRFRRYFRLPLWGMAGGGRRSWTSILKGFLILRSHRQRRKRGLLL